MKIFVTGVSGSGKTSLAQSLAAEKKIPFVSFDSYEPYEAEKSGYSAEKLFSELPEAFVIDAIPFDENLSWRTFTCYENENEVSIICTYCPDRDLFLARHKDRQPRIDENKKSFFRVLTWQNISKVISSKDGFRKALEYFSASSKRLIKRILAHLPLIKELFPISPTNDGEHRFYGTEKIKDQHLKEFRYFYTSNMQVLHSYKNVSYYDTIANEYTDAETVSRRLKAQLFPLEEHLYNATYDVGYQDIEIINFIGYSDSSKTWERIKDQVNWKGKTCVDLGCFHGFFSFKMEDQGAFVTGLDAGSAVIKTARMINQLRGGNVRFMQWMGGQSIPDSDVVLCLNVLHHFGGEDIQKKALQNIHAPEVIFEVNLNQVSLIEKHFLVKEYIPSHRYQRKILVCARKNESSTQNSP